MLHSGMMATVRRLEELSKHEGLAPQHNLSVRFLGEQEADANYDSRFLADAWATLTSKMEDVVEEMKKDIRIGSVTSMTAQNRGVSAFSITFWMAGL